jgi:hypothetical protein
MALSHPKGRQASTATAATASLSSSASRSASPSVSESASTSKSAASTSSAASHSSSKTSSTDSTPNVPVTVLNNTNSSGLAETAVARLKNGGWTAKNGGNFVGDILSTAAYYDPNSAGAQAAAQALRIQFPAIKRVVQRFGGLPEGPIILVLTTDYS